MSGLAPRPSSSGPPRGLGETNPRAWQRGNSGRPRHSDDAYQRIHAAETDAQQQSRIAHLLERLGLRAKPDTKPE